MKLELYLDGNLVDINQDIDFVLNKKYTELSDLTSIIVDYSKTIRIPMTPRNNELFNYVFKLDHQVLLGQDIINYDPSQKIPMSMVYNGSTPVCVHAFRHAHFNGQVMQTFIVLCSGYGTVFEKCVQQVLLPDIQSGILVVVFR